MSITTIQRMPSTLRSINSIIRAIVATRVPREEKAHLRHRMSAFTAIEGVEVVGFPRLAAAAAKV